MSDDAPAKTKLAHQRIRWWPAVFIIVATTIAVTIVRTHPDWPFQRRNQATAYALIPAFALLVVWWSFLSRAPGRVRLPVTFGILAVLVALPAVFRIRGVSGDLVPILEPRWAGSGSSVQTVQNAATAPTNLTEVLRPDFPQFLGPNRNAVLPGPGLETNWMAHPPAVVWRQRIGAGWSGFSIVGDRAFTQEQRGEDECVVCYDLTTGRELWRHADQARYDTTLAGEGPRATPTVAGGRVFTLGATGILNCLDMESGRLIWSHNIIEDAGSEVLDWGMAGSPLVLETNVVVSAGGTRNKSLIAYRASDGQIAWAAGSALASYSSPFLATLAGVRQILVFNDGFITSHDATTGAVLWEYPWGVNYQHVAVPIPVGTNRVVFTAGYGAGCEMLEIELRPNGRLAPRSVWKTKKMKAKFANPVARDGFLYGLDDGILACVDLQDGSQRWKEGRYGHGQGLLIGELYLLMSESGELVLLRPTPEAPNELARFRVFNSKTWNTIALSGDLLLVRNDTESACLRLTLTQ
jgi:outer membrane protein assembly factor BamB